MLHDDIYQRMKQHVVNVHADIIVNDEHGVKVLKISERKNVENRIIVVHDQAAVVIVHYDSSQIMDNVDV